jgi:GntR family transcriptional regulator
VKHPNDVQVNACSIGGTAPLSSEEKPPLVVRPQPFYQQVANTLREDIRSGRYQPGDRLPSERELVERFKVSAATTRAAIVQLRAEGLVTSHQGRGVFVAERPPLRRLGDDIVWGEGFYAMVARQGLQPDVATTVTRAPATEEAADALGVPAGTEVLVHTRLVRAEGPPLFLAANYFPMWVVATVPQLAAPSDSGLTKWLTEAFGPLYGEDVIDARMPTEEERERLEIPPDTPVVIIKGTNRDQEHRPLHYIEKVTVAGRVQYGYRFGVVPEE